MGERTKLTWQSAETKFILISWSELKDQIGKSQELKTKEKAYTSITGKLNQEFAKNFTSKQVADKLKNLARTFREKIDNNDR